jgi:fructokinase
MQVFCFGELLIDLLADAQGKPLEKVTTFNRAPGGAPANVARNLAKLGVETAFMGLLGDDPFGRYLADDLASAGVDTQWIGRSPRITSPLAFVATQRDGGKQVAFAGMESWASALAESAELDRPVTPGPGRWLHVGGVASAWPELHHRQRAILNRARGAGWRTSLDVNFRPALFQDRPDLFAARMNELLPLVDLVKVSDEELDATLHLDASADPEAALDRLLAMGPTVAAVTHGADGVIAKARGRDLIELRGIAVEQVEPTGAGDAFMAALIAGLGRTPPSAGDLLATGPATSTPWPSDDALRFALDLANECGALAVTAVGATISFRSLPRATYPALHQWRNSDQ